MYNICIIDDRIPVSGSVKYDDTKRIDSYTIKNMLDDSTVEWSEAALKGLFVEFIKDDYWSVSAFRNPELYLKYIEEEYYSPDFIIFDWEYDVISEPVESILRQIIEKHYCIISVYTGQDERSKIEEIIQQEFSDYKNRLSVFIKTDESSAIGLKGKAKILAEENFSFRFSKELRNHLKISAENILVEFGKLDINAFVYLLGSRNEKGNYNLNTQELSEIVTERIRAKLTEMEFGVELPETNGGWQMPEDNLLPNKVWSYRLYNKPKDDVVRKGDMYYINSDISKLYFVLSSDCHLNNFWSKNYGYISLVPLYLIAESNTELKSKLEYYKDIKNIRGQIKVSSLTELSGLSQGPTIIPCVEWDGVYNDYLLFPRELFSKKIEIPSEGENNKNDYRKKPLKYSHFTDHNTIKRVKLVEPFTTSLVEHIRYNLTSYGVPDYPTLLADSIKNSFNDMLK